VPEIFGGVELADPLEVGLLLVFTYYLFVGHKSCESLNIYIQGVSKVPGRLDNLVVTGGHMSKAVKTG